ncbi:hypothetical protein SLEP1_g38807 [Rubroshorea leprosula]|uniref:Uncharacterized protein n=1 Tax=Rubroshorea leprosula TaxID=152421 RepID=A0AAV5KYW6_9ROSI|nr:hypothetical protein SLEP1_g38807 [Rubroshorea leprosula]
MLGPLLAGKFCLISCCDFWRENPVRLASVLANLWKSGYCSRRGTVHWYCSSTLFTPRGPTFNGNLND